MPDWRVNALEGIYKFSAAYLMQKRYQILADYATHDLDTRELSRVNRYFFFTSACIRQYDWTIEQCCLHIRVFFGGKRTELRFDVAFKWRMKHTTNTYRNRFSRSYENRSNKS